MRGSFQYKIMGNVFKKFRGKYVYGSICWTEGRYICLVFWLSGAIYYYLKVKIIIFKDINIFLNISMSKWFFFFCWKKTHVALQLREENIPFCL